MRTIKLLILLLLVNTFTNLHAQIAVVSGLKVGTALSEKVVQDLFDNINSKYINAVVFLGDITNSGEESEFNDFNVFLERYLSPDDYIIPGMRDIQNNPTGYYFTKDQFDGTRIRLDSSDIFMAGLSNYSPRGSGARFYNTDIKWLDSLLTSVPQNKMLFFFSPAPLSRTDNWYKVYNLFSQRNSTFLFTTGKENSIKKFRDTDEIVLKPSVENGSWNYNVIKPELDSLYIYNYKSDSTVTLWASLPVNGKQPVSPIDTHIVQTYGSEILWEIESGTNIPAPVLVTENRIFYCSLNGVIGCMDLQGKSIWRHNIERTITTSPIRDKDLLIVTTVDGDLFSINSNNGNIVEIIGTGEPLTLDPILVDIENLSGKYKGVILGTSSGRIICYDIYSFELIWDVSEVSGKITSLKVVDGKLFAASGSFIYSINQNNGKLIWKWNAGRNVSITSIEAAGKYVFVSTFDKFVYAVDLLLGSTVWKKNDMGAAAIKLSDDSKELFIKTIRDGFLILNPENGNVSKRIQCSFAPGNENSSIIEHEQEILFSSPEGKLFKTNKQSKCSEVFFLGGGYLHTLTLLSNGSYLVANDQGLIINISLKKE